MHFIVGFDVMYFNAWGWFYTCWAFNERSNNKFYYKVASCWLFILSHTTMHGSMNIYMNVYIKKMNIKCTVYIFKMFVINIVAVI